MFNQGDFIKTKSSGRIGIIKNFGHMVKPGKLRPAVSTFYYIEWLDATGKMHRYFEDEIRDEWELYYSSNGGMVYHGSYHNPPTPPEPPETGDIKINPSFYIDPGFQNKKDDLMDAVRYFMDSGVTATESKPDPKTCNHSWKVYNSGFTKFEYCEHCDIKKDEA